MEKPLVFIIDNIDRLKYTARILSQFKERFDNVEAENRYFPSTNRHHIVKEIFPALNVHIIVTVPSEVYEQAEHGFTMFNEYLNHYSNE